MDKLSEYGPKMAALTELQRNYIKAMASAPFASATEWARMAGYSDRSGGAKVAAFHLRHDPKIEEAVLEYAAYMMHRDGPLLAVAGLMEIARNKKHPKQLRALETLANRVGLHELTEHRVRVEHLEESAAAKVERIRQVAQLLGIELGQLLGRNVSPETIGERKLIESTGGRRGAGIS
jgi:phage terminase small subunit